MDKVCPQCKINKSFCDFYRDKSKKFCLETYCKACSLIRRRKYKTKPYSTNELHKRYIKFRNLAKTKFHSIKTNCPRRGVEFNLNKEEFIEWYDTSKKNCFYCGRQLTQFERGSDSLTIDRVDNAIGYEITNIVLCCRRCNIIKGSWFTSQEMAGIATKYLKDRR